ncbi:MAG TPA: hypothetical protein VIG73_08630 [Cerasibacillus sp.]|uniref:alpha/beta fold hydrolase n=1 Tax=Cerasibacillus sp. TaxID=2498711 RepID=UPI002F3F8DC3
MLDPYYVAYTENLSKKTNTVIQPRVNQEIMDEVIQTYDIRNKVPVLKEIPTMILQGTKDMISPDDIRRTILKEIVRAQFIEFHESGHWMFMEEADKFNHVVNNFFEKIIRS